MSLTSMVQYKGINKKLSLLDWIKQFLYCPGGRLLWWPDRGFYEAQQSNKVSNGSQRNSLRNVSRVLGYIYNWGLTNEKYDVYLGTLSFVFKNIMKLYGGWSNNFCYYFIIEGLNKRYQTNSLFNF